MSDLFLPDLKGRDWLQTASSGDRISPGASDIIFYKAVQCQPPNQQAMGCLPRGKAASQEVIDTPPSTKGHPITGHEGPEGEQRYTPTLPSTPALDGGWVVNATPRPLYPRERPGTRCTGGWVGPRAVLDRYGKPRPRRESIPGSSSP